MLEKPEPAAKISSVAGTVQKIIHPLDPGILETVEMVLECAQELSKRFHGMRELLGIK